MDILIIYAHPETKGFCFHILQQVKTKLSQKGANFEVLDLYQINYDPVMKEEELYTAGNKKVNKENKEMQAKIEEAEKLVFIYPVWWASMPAILKGFLDRVFTPGFAFTYKGERLISAVPEGLLKEKEALVFQTLGGPRWAYFLLGNPPKRMIKLFALWYSGIQTKVTQIFNANKLDAERKKEVTKMVQRSLGFILN